MPGAPSIKIKQDSSPFISNGAKMSSISLVALLVSIELDQCFDDCLL